MNPRVVAEVYRYDGRPTRAIVDLDAISGNLAVVRRLVGPRVGIMAVVKANAYGHGAIAVGQAAIDAGAEQLGVATVDEAVQLRVAGIRAPVLVLGPIDNSEIDLAIGHTIELSVGDLAFARAVGAAAELFGVSSPISLHLKVDTGMRRFGATRDEAVEIARFIDNHPLLRLRAVFTHFARADELDPEPTDVQSELLDAILSDLAAAEIQPEIVHAANSAATLRSSSYHRRLVRLGIALYGLNPSAEIQIAPEMRPAMTIVSRIERLFDLQIGDGVSYGASYRATSRGLAALVPIGYADGYDRGLSNRSEMYVQSVRCQVLGRVCMDQTVIGLPPDSIAFPGDTVVVAGAWESAGPPTFDELATTLGTINYEIASGLAVRVPRFYARSGTVVAVSDLSGYRIVSNPTSTNT